MSWQDGCLACIVWFGLGIQPAMAGDAKALTLKEARQIALQNHPRITRAELVAMASKQVVVEVRSALLPTAVFNSTSVGIGDSNTRIAAGELNNPEIYNRNAEGVAVSQLITDFGRTSHLLSSSRLQSRAEEQNTEATREEVFLQVDVAYYAALKAQAVLEVAHQTLETRKLLLDQINALAQNKLRSALDVSFAQVAYEGGRLLVAKADNDLHAAFAALDNVLGYREPHSFHLVEEPMRVAAPEDESALLSEALTQRPDLIRLRYQRDAAIQFAQAEKALYYPTIAAFGAGGVIPVHDPQLKDRYAAAGINLSLPLFEGGLFAARESEAKLRAQASAEALRDAEDNVVRDVRTASLNEAYAFQRLDLTQKLLDNASRAFDLAQARYTLGSSSIVELSQAQLSLTEAEIDHTNAKYEYQIQCAILNYDIGAVR
jgi:outer membrane protein